MALSSRWNGPFTIDTPTGELLPVYVNLVTGDDNNDGDTPESPILNFQAYIDRFKNPPKRGRIVHLTSGVHSQWQTPLGWGWYEPLIFVGDGAGQSGDTGYTVLRAAELAQAGTTDRIVVTTGGVTSAMLGKTLRVLDGSGNPTGVARHINRVVGNDLYLNFRVTGLAAGAQFDVVESAVSFSWDDSFDVAWEGRSPNVPSTTYNTPNFLPTNSGLCFINVEQQHSGDFSGSRFVGGPVILFGVESPDINRMNFTDANVLAAMDVVSGIANPWTQIAPFIAQVGADFPQTAQEIVTNWTGWGLALTGLGSTRVSNFTGFVTASENTSVQQVHGTTTIKGGGGRLIVRPSAQMFLTTESGASFYCEQNIASALLTVEGPQASLRVNAGTGTVVLFENDGDIAVDVNRGATAFIAGGPCTIRSNASFGINSTQGYTIVQGGGLVVQGSIPGTNDLTVDGAVGISLASLAGGAPQSDGGNSVVQREV